MSAESTTAGRYDCREIYAKTLEALAEKDERIVAVVNDSVGSSKLVGFQKRFPDRLINVGIAEQMMVGVGAGLANGGTAVEDPPGVREGGGGKLYLAYLRDPDGNKIVGLHRVPA